MKIDPKYPDGIRPDLFQDGLEYQDFIYPILAQYGIVITNHASKKFQYEKGENPQGVEIKLDNRCTETGNVSIEIAEKSKANNKHWIPSGICREKDNTWLYVQGNGKIIFVFSRKTLLAWLKQRKPKQLESHGTIRKFHLVREDAILIASLVIEILSADGKQHRRIG